MALNNYSVSTVYVILEVTMKSNALKICLCIMAILLLFPLVAVPNIGQDKPQTQQRNRYQAAIEQKARIDAIFEAQTKGILDYKKFTYKSSEGQMDIPAYLFAPLEKRGTHAHPLLIWVHGGVHGNLGNLYLPFIKDACERGYVVICPEYRGSTGYGEEHMEAIDYGGFEVEDCISAVDSIQGRDMSYIDPNRKAMIGWSHGGLITLHGIIRRPDLFICGVAIVPVTNLVFRLAYKGPGYQSLYTKQERLGGNTWENRDAYIARSPVYQIDDLQVPVLVHLADNDRDVNFVEAEMLVNALRVKKPELAETKIYHDPRGGHTFNRQVNRDTWERDDTPEQKDSWNRIWTFLEWHLRPYEWEKEN